MSCIVTCFFLFPRKNSKYLFNLFSKWVFSTLKLFSLPWEYLLLVTVCVVYSQHRSATIIFSVEIYNLLSGWYRRRLSSTKKNCTKFKQNWEIKKNEFAWAKIQTRKNRIYQIILSLNPFENVLCEEIQSPGLTLQTECTISQNRTIYSPYT